MFVFSGTDYDNFTVVRGCQDSNGEPRSGAVIAGQSVNVLPCNDTSYCNHYEPPRPPQICWECGTGDKEACDDATLLSNSTRSNCSIHNLYPNLACYTQWTVGECLPAYNSSRSHSNEL